MNNKLAVAALVVSLSAIAADRSDILKSYALNDGSTVHVFKDGKMAVENPFGRAVSVKEGQVLEAKDGTRITMKGNEVARLDHLLNVDRRGH
ncbi:copper resistance protein CopK [Cupriavidus sp. SK-3]|uniref:periplasmic Cu(I)/Cu(II)-binding protein CopK n=1 Tax=Cupriavidus sp. SK-3 TaxID=1470558 RepID=UPI00044CF3BC|nr:periplasmic Cu(I)/Cu(II)-binding protein CopK [Cupriavidus sp. SK-3]KDP87198.1 copper resistance protein CopK [Cupriavidus sp. SK-3]